MRKMKIKQYQVPIGWPYAGDRSAYFLIPETKEEAAILNRMAEDCMGTNRLGFNRSRKQEKGAVGIELKLFTQTDDEDHHLNLRGGKHKGGGPGLRLDGL